MERFRRNKGPLLLPVLCLAAALLIYLVVNSLWGAASVARQLSLGQQYLTDMNIEMPAEPVRVQWRPKHEDLIKAHQLGKSMAEVLKAKCQD